MEGNRPRHRHVVLVVGTIRGVGAALTAAVLVLSGCGSTEVDMTTTSPPPETAVNPWDLPLEERPPLFDPCTEIPIEAVREALGHLAEPVKEYQQNKPGELKSCGWENEEIDISILSTWKSYDDYVNDPRTSILDINHHQAERAGILAAEKIGSSNVGCIFLVFTERGTIWLRSDMLDTLQEYKGRHFVDPCTVLDDIAPSFFNYIPSGDFR